MIKILFLTLIFLASSFAFCCEVQLPQNILILGEGSRIVQTIPGTHCSEELLNEINSALNSVDGKISALQLSEIVKSKNLNVIINPPLIQIRHLRNLVREQMDIPQGIQLKSSEAINAENFISLSPDDEIKITCNDCLYGAQQPLNLVIRSVDGNDRSLTIRADFKKMVKAYRTTVSLPAFSEVYPQVLSEEFVEVIPHTDLVTDLNILKFYKSNKPIRPGQLLRQSDLNAINLVRAGVKTDVIIENELLKLKSSGISRGNGTYGQYVEVFHPQKNKKYLGKVIDLNKVSVEL